MAALHCAYALSALVVAVCSVIGTPTAGADNKRINDGVVANVYTMQHRAGCITLDGTVVAEQAPGDAAHCVAWL